MRRVFRGAMTRARLGRFATAAAGLCLMGAVSACQSGPNLGALGQEDGTPSIETITAEELRAYCPRVQLREGTAYFTTYAGDEESPEKVRYQASISDVTRSCAYNEGRLTMNIAVAGRVLLGPSGSPGTLTMPIRVAVLRGGEEVVYSQLHDYQVNVQASGATQFVFNDPNVTIDAPTSRNIIVFAGFDEGPPTASARVASR